MIIIVLIQDITKFQKLILFQMYFKKIIILYHVEKCKNLFKKKKFKNENRNSVFCVLKI